MHTINRLLAFGTRKAGYVLASSKVWGNVLTLSLEERAKQKYMSRLNKVAKYELYNYGLSVWSGEGQKDSTLHCLNEV